MLTDSTPTYPATGYANRRPDSGIELLEVRRLLSAYTLTDLGTVGGAESYAYDLNDSNVVVGYARTATGQDRAFRFFDANGNRAADPGEMTGLGALSGHAASYGYGINDAGQIVGTSRTTPLVQKGDERAVRFNPGTSPTDLNLGDGSNAYEINEAGQIVGGATFNVINYHAFLRSPAGQVTSFALTGSEFGRTAEAHAVNEAGVVAGYSAGDFGASGFVRSAGGMMTAIGFDSPETLDYNYAWDLNASGQVVGEGFNPDGDYRAFRYDGNGAVADLGTLEGFASSQAFGINDVGVIVGRVEPPEGAGGHNHAFVYQSGVMRDLNDLIPAGSGWTLTEAREVNDNGAIVGWGVSPTGSTRAFLLLPTGAAAVTGRHVFYNNSFFDGNNPAPNAQDADAIAPGKSPLLPGGTATESNYTDFSKGITGVMVDVLGLPPNLIPTAADFTFRAGNDNNPAAWAPAAQPLVTVFRGGGFNGTDRITLTWPDNAVKATWLQVVVKATANTGLAAADVFYYGNLPGDTFNSAAGQGFAVNSLDVQRTRINQFQQAPITSLFDHDKSNNIVNAIDVQLSRINQFSNLARIAVPIGPAAARGAPPAAPASAFFLSAMTAPGRAVDDLPEELD